MTCPFDIIGNRKNRINVFVYRLELAARYLVQTRTDRNTSNIFKSVFIPAPTVLTYKEVI